MNRRTITLIITAVLMFFMVSAAADAAIFYNVRAKDTLWKISKKFGVSMDAILKANKKLKDEKNLKVGTVLVIPDNSEEIIPVENDTTSTHTLIVHGSGNQYSPKVEKAVNVMTVNGKSIKVPAVKAKRRARGKYRKKYHKMASRGFKMGNSIVKSAFNFMGTPYIFGGSTPRGFDCSGFVQYVYRKNGIKTPRMAHHQYYAGTPISKKQLRPGDLVFFETYTKGISHVGIYIGNRKFIHASSRGYVCVSRLDKPYYRNRYRGAARY